MGLEATTAGVIVYYPVFETQPEFTNHYHRAAWYLPKTEGVIDEVVLGVSEKFRQDKRPSYMGAPRQPVDHIRQENNQEHYAQSLAQADTVLVWKSAKIGIEQEREFVGKRVVYVDTEDPELMEWGAYCGLHWWLLGSARRHEILTKSQEMFREVMALPEINNSHASAVFGTGPSVEKALELDFSRCTSIVCNTAIKDDKLLAHVRPKFVTAGDAVSHFGVSLYADCFRKDLATVLPKYDMYLFSTAMYGNILRVQFPELEDRILLCEQTTTVPVFDLSQYWGLPKLDSTLNVHMLPLAGTFNDRVYLLGCDGRRPDGKDNEDFWGHSRRTQYHELVDTGHEAHPMFDVRRQRITESFFRESTMYTLALGERKYNKTYISLARSFTPAIDRRVVGCKRRRVNGESGPWAVASQEVTR